MASFASSGLDPRSVPESGTPSSFTPAVDRHDLAALGLLLASLIALFWQLLFTTAMPFYRDVFTYSYPHARFIHDLCRQGRLPYWDPYFYYGQPLLANPNFLFFYPDTLLIVLLPIDFGFKLHYIGHFAIAAVGAYGLARQWSQSRVAAFFTAFVFSFSGPVLSLGNFYNHVACAAWIPWALWLTDVALESSSRRPACAGRPWVLLTLVFSLQFLAGEPLTFLATFGLCVALALRRAGVLLRPLAGPGRRLLARFALLGVLVLALSAAQLFPSLSLLEFSRRGQGLPYQEVIEWSLHPLALLELTLPEFFGPLLESGSTWTEVLDWRFDPYFVSIFVGGAPLFFALAGWALGRDPRKRFLWGSILTLLLAAFGGFAPFFALAYLLIPPLGMVRYPVKLLVPIVLLIAISAGWGLDALRDQHLEWKERPRRLLAPLAGFIAGVVAVWAVAWIAPGVIAQAAAWILHRTDAIVTWPRQPILTAGQVAGGTQYLIMMLRRMLPGLVGYAVGGLSLVLALERRRAWAPAAVLAFAALGLAQLAAVNSRVNPTVPREFYTYRPAVLSSLPDRSPAYRVYTEGRPLFLPPSSLRTSDFFNLDSIPQAAALTRQAQSAFRDKLLLLRGAMLAGVETAAAIDVDGSAPEFYFQFCLFDLLDVAGKPEADCLLGRTNVNYAVEHPRGGSSVLRKVAEVFNGSSEPSILYENLCAVPRAYVAGRAVFSESTRETLSKMAAPDFPAEKEVLIFGNGLAAPETPVARSPGRVETISRTPNEVVLRADLARPGYLVLLDRFDPDWHATLDDREVPILRANLMFRAVQAPVGQHEVRFYYRQRGLKAGVILSGLTLLFLAIAYAMGRPGRRND